MVHKDGVQTLRRQQADAVAQEFLVSLGSIFSRCKGKGRDGANNEERCNATVLKHLC